MRADGVHVAVRPRGILECLDLAVMFCGRRPLAVALAVAVGAIPCILINRLLLGGWRDNEGLLFVGAIVLSIEAAWASVPLTLYLGQAVFSERFAWRLAAGAFLRSLPALVFFQGVLRPLCLVIVFLSPVVFVGMYYLNQVILLERPPFTRIWSRRTAINQRNIGHVLSLAVLDAVILVVGVPLVTGLLGAVSALWRGRAVQWLPSFVGEGSIGLTLFTWHGQIAFWSVCGLVTVFRFFTYLDARIRREGWDVELKLRSAATYGGLTPTDAGGRPAAGNRLAGLAGCLAILAVATAAASGLAADATADGDGGGARRALTRHSFPWYDSDADRYRPLIKPLPGESAAEEESGDDSDEGRTGSGRRSGSARGKGSGSGTGGGSGSGSGTSSRRVSLPRLPSLSLPSLDLGNVGWILMVTLFVVAVLVVVYLVVRYGLADRDRPDVAADDGPAVESLDEERLAALPAGARLAGGDLLARAAAHAERGEFERAMVFFHAWQLVELDRRGGLALARGKTNGQYIAEVTAAAPAISSLFRRSSRLFEDAFFGDLPVPRADFLAVWEDRDRITSFVRAAGD